MTHDKIREAAGLDSDAFAAGLDRFERRAQRKTSLQALGKLAEQVDGNYRIRSDPPVLYRLDDIPDEGEADKLRAGALEALEQYKSTLADDRHWILDRYTPVDIGVKVVGVGSVGTRCLILLLLGRDERDPLFLQAKEAGPSVLEEHLEPSPYENHGRRVVEGQRMVQAESDIFLGWTRGSGGRDYYLRQLRDWKGSVDLESATRTTLQFYAGVCGRTMARGHARSGDAVAIGAYVGNSDSLDKSVTAFAEAYAVQNRSDYERFTAAIRDGRLDAAQPDGLAAAN
jgi:uncharacterized protein (DUF2252 family)